MFCDPGLSGTGLAVFDGLTLIECEQVTGYKEYSWQENCMSISVGVGLLCEALNPAEFYFELPQFMQNAGKTNYSGDFVKLCMVTGAIHQEVGGVRHVDKIIAVPIPSWKGNVPKPMMAKRIKSHCDRLHFTIPPKASTHEIDAIGIGLYCLGLMK
jgi:hypothetical protein